MRKLGFIYKYIDQFFFSLLNVGTIAFVSKYLSSELAAKYILINTYASFSLIVVVALVITPFWVHSANRNSDNFVFGSKFAINLSLLTGVIISAVYILKQNGNYHDVIQIILVSVSYPMYDFLRRTLYVENKEIISAITTVVLSMFIGVGYWLLYLQGATSYQPYVYLLAIGLIIASCALLISNLIIRKTDAKEGNIEDKNYYHKIKEYFVYGRWSAISMICFWLSTQGLFVFLYGKISDDELVVSRLCLSLTGIISIYFASIENKLMPDLRRAYVSNDINYIKTQWKMYWRNGLLISIPLSLSIYVIYILYYGGNLKYSIPFILLALYQILTGVFKYYAYVLKSAQKHKETFYSNLFGVVFTYILAYSFIFTAQNVIALMVLANGILCSVAYYFFLKKDGVLNEK
ncbi:TPA: hypothetical protein ACWL6H_003830 [Klebsiella quasipneumoniae]|nr:hypothetical protein [Klebsiella quasipneumoniae subsp. quasipneumoniae]HDG7810375.1 hypothetical protein [Klebsiella quasipneumoniae]